MKKLIALMLCLAMVLCFAGCGAKEEAPAEPSEDIKLLQSIEAELKKLVIHSMLHLFGYDHIKDEDFEIMNN